MTNDEKREHDAMYRNMALDYAIRLNKPGADFHAVLRDATAYYKFLTDEKSIADDRV